MKDITFYQISEIRPIAGWACASFVPMEDEIYFDNLNAIERVKELSSKFIAKQIQEFHYDPESDADDMKQYPVIVTYQAKDCFIIIKRQFKDNTKSELPF